MNFIFLQVLKTSKNMNFIFCKLKKLKKHEFHVLQAYYTGELFHERAIPLSFFTKGLYRFFTKGLKNVKKHEFHFLQA